MSEHLEVYLALFDFEGSGKQSQIRIRMKWDVSHRALIMTADFSLRTSDLHRSKLIRLMHMTSDVRLLAQKFHGYVPFRFRLRKFSSRLLRVTTAVCTASDSL